VCNIYSASVHFGAEEVTISGFAGNGKAVQETVMSFSFWVVLGPQIQR